MLNNLHGSAFGLRHLAEQIPDEAAELASERDDDLLFHQSAVEQVSAAFVEPDLGLPRKVAVEVVLALLAHGQLRGDLGRKETMLHGFDQDPAGVAVTGLGDGAEMTTIAGGRFPGHQAQITHEVTGMIKPSHITQFGDQDGRGGQLEAAQAHERLHRGVHPPLGHLGGDQVVEALEPVGRIGDSREAFLQHGLLRSDGQNQFSEVTAVGVAPVGLALVPVTVAQQKRFELLFDPAQIVDGVGTGPGEVADRFVERVGHVDRLEFASPMEPGQLLGVAPVGLLAPALFLRRLGRGDHDAVDRALFEPAVDHKAGRPGFVDKVQPDLFAPELGQQFFQCMQVV